jgi:DNA-binding NarL/FixJ family response regulator
MALGANAGQISVLIADDHPVLRAGLRQVLERDPSIRVIAEVEDGEAALDRIQADRPDIAVLDIEMPKRDGLDVVRELRRLALPTRVIMLSLHDDETRVTDALALGARGYILKDDAIHAIVDGVKAVAAGRPYVTPSLSGLLLQRRERTRELTARQPGLADLTPAERRVLALIARGQASKDIAIALGIHYRTVENHRVSIAQKLGLHGHNAVLKFAMEHREQL